MTTLVSIPKGEATNRYFENKRYEDIIEFQSPKGRLQTLPKTAQDYEPIGFQSPKGRLQTVHYQVSGIEDVVFQSPKGRLQTQVLVQEWKQ